MLLYHRMQVLLQTTIMSVKNADFEKIDSLKRYDKRLCLKN